MATLPATPQVPPHEAVASDANFAHCPCRDGGCSEPRGEEPCDRNAPPEDEFDVDEFADDELDEHGPQDVDLQAAECDLDGFDDAEPRPEYGDFWIDTDDMDDV